jgi:GAF domain-containing protein
MSDGDLGRVREHHASGLEMDPGLAWRKQLLGRLIVGQTIAISVLTLMITLGWLLMPGSGLLALVPLGVITASVGLVAYWLLRRGQLDLATYVFLLGTSVAITSNVVVRGFEDVSGIYYLWPILGAVFLLGTWGGFAVTVVSALLYLSLVLLQSFGVLTPPLPVDPQMGAAFSVVSRLLMFFLLAFLGWLASQGLDRALRQSSHAAQGWKDLSETLEQRVADRTRDLERRAVQLATAAEVGRAAASMLELDRLLDQVAELIKDRFGLYYAALFLIDEIGDYAVLEAGSGEAGRVMKEAGHRLAIGGRSMVGRACSERQARVALDVGAEPVRFDNPLLPDTRSEMALPLMVGARVLGALDVQSSAAAAFSQSDIAVLQLVADQVAVAVDNALKFSEEAGLLEATSPLYRISHRMTAATTVGEVSQAILSTVRETEADGCAVAQFDRTPDGEIKRIGLLDRWARRALPDQSSAAMSVELVELLPLSLVSRLTMVDDVMRDDRIPEGARAYLTELGVSALVTIPLRVGSSGRLQGFLAVDRQTPGAFSPVSLRLYETLAEQAAVALERARLLDASQRQAWREHQIREVSDRVASSFDLDQLVQTTVEELGKMFRAAGGYVEMAPSAGTRPVAGEGLSGNRREGE